MSGSYWKVGDKINIGQTDIEISCEGGKEYKENQTIGIYIPPSVKFFSGKDSVLQFDLKLATNELSKVCLDGVIGAHSLFSRVACYAGNRSQLLEELTEYPSFVNVKYSYDTSDALRNKRAMTEGCGTWSPQSQGTMGTNKSIQSDTIFSPFFENKNKGKAPTETIDAACEFLTARITMPLHMGCWANSTKAFPNLLTNGLYLELTCAQNRSVIKVLDQTTIYRKLSYAPVFESTNGNADEWNSGSNLDHLYTSNDNGQLHPESSPFQVGETIGLWDRQNNAEATFSGALVISSIEAGDASNKQSIKYNFATARQPTATLAAGGKRYVLYSKTRTAAFAPSYTISNPKMVVRALDMGDQYTSGMLSKMKQGGMIMFDLPSIACSLQSVGANEVQATIPIVCEHAKARSVICMGTDSKPYSAKDSADSANTFLINDTEPNALSATEGKRNYSQQSGYSGIGDNLTSYSFIIDQKQTPSRRVDTSKTTSTGAGIDQNHLIELEKSLQQSHGCVPRSFVNYQNNFLIGRALTLDSNTIYDGRNKDMRLNLRYEDALSTGRAARKEKLWKIFISHIKTIMIKGDSIMVEN